MLFCLLFHCFELVQGSTCVEESIVGAEKKEKVLSTWGRQRREHVECNPSDLYDVARKKIEWQASLTEWIFKSHLLNDQYIIIKAGTFQFANEYNFKSIYAIKRRLSITSTKTCMRHRRRVKKSNGLGITQNVHTPTTNGFPGVRSVSLNCEYHTIRTYTQALANFVVVLMRVKRHALGPIHRKPEIRHCLLFAQIKYCPPSLFFIIYYSCMKLWALKRFSCHSHAAQTQHIIQMISWPTELCTLHKCVASKKLNLNILQLLKSGSQK